MVCNTCCKSDLEHDKDCAKRGQSELDKLSQVAGIAKTCFQCSEGWVFLGLHAGKGTIRLGSTKLAEVEKAHIQGASQAVASLQLWMNSRSDFCTCR